MTGFKITHNKDILSVGTDSDDALLTIHINSSINSGDFIFAGCTEYSAQKKNIWHDFTPINLGDEFHIRLTDGLSVDPPLKSTHDNRIKRPISRVEAFYKLEALLKEEGLL